MSNDGLILRKSKSAMSKTRAEFFSSSKSRPTSRSSGLLLFGNSSHTAADGPYCLEMVPRSTPRFGHSDSAHGPAADSKAAAEIDEEAIDAAEESGFSLVRPSSPAPEIVEDDQGALPEYLQQDAAHGFDASPAVEEIVCCNSPLQKTPDSVDMQAFQDSDTDAKDSPAASNRRPSPRCLLDAVAGHHAIAHEPEQPRPPMESSSTPCAAALEPDPGREEASEDAAAAVESAATAATPLPTAADPQESFLR